MGDSNSECCETNKTSCCGGEEKEICMCKLTQPPGKFDIEKVLPLVNAPRFICKCCGRMANQGEHLCNPMPLSK